MSFVGYLEVLVNFHSLRNIDLFHQGIYQLRTHAYRELAIGVAQSGEPNRLNVNPTEVSEKASLRSGPNPHFLARPFLNEANRSFTTRTFRIRFCDEEVEIHDGAIFRFEVDLADPLCYTNPIYIEVSLQHAGARRKNDVQGYKRGDDEGPPRNGTTREQEKDEDDLKNLQFTESAFQVFTVENPIEGVADYFQLNFDQLHFCAVHCTVHTAFVDIRGGTGQNTIHPVLPARFRTIRPPPSLQHSPKEWEGITSTQQNYKRAEEVGDSAHTEESGPQMKPVLTFAEHLADVVSGLNLTESFCQPSASDTGKRTTTSRPNDKKRSSVARPAVPKQGVISTRPENVPRLPLGMGERDIGKMLLTRCDLVYKNYATLLLRSYYKLRIQYITYSTRYLSHMERESLSWLPTKSTLSLPGSIEIPSKPNGLPDLSQVSQRPGMCRISFMIPAHLCIDVADDFVANGGPPTLAGALRGVSVLFFPPSARVHWRGREKYKRGSLSTELQNCMASDLTLLWRQVHEIWHKMRLLIAIAHRETQFYHQFIWEKRMAARYREVVFLEVHNSFSAALPIEKDVGLIHGQIAEDLRNRQSEKFPSMPVEDAHAPFDIQNHPIIFEEKYLSHHDGTSPAFRVMERRNRLASLEGGLADVIAEEASREIMMTRRDLAMPPLKLPHPVVNSDDIGTELLLTSRREREKTEMGALAWMKRVDEMQVFETVLTARGEKKEGDTLYMGSSQTPLDSLRKKPFPETGIASSGIASPGIASPTTTAGSEFQTPRFEPTVEETASQCDLDSSGSSDSGGLRLTDLDKQFLKLHCPVFDRDPSAPKNYQGLHLIVLIHGFQGHPSDMRIIRNNLSIVFPEGIYLVSSLNEDRTDDDIGTLGDRLAKEIISYVKELCPGDSIGRLSFVAHSLGGLIVRSALGQLSAFHSRFHLFLTLSSPHLGYLFARNKLIDAGLWLLKKWKKSNSLQQLSMSDARDIRDTFVYKLSMAPELQYFKHVVFVSSHQDQYAPYESARVEAAERILRDPLWGSIHMEMVKNILCHVKKDKLTRLDVCFKLSDRSLDSLIGRAAHLHFIGSQQLAQTLIFTYPQWFA